MPPRTNDTPRFRHTVVLYARIDEEIMTLIRELADTNERSISSTVQIVLRKGLNLNPIQPLFRFTEEDEP